ncbi:MAG: hypothetical protein ACRDPR_09220 [Nocardioidaceae bacterium]
MSAAVPHAGDRADGAELLARARHRRRVELFAVLATLAIITGPLVAGAIGLVGRLAPVDEESLLTPNAQRALEELDGAFARGGLVVVPADLDPDVVWSGPVGLDRVDGTLVDLAVHGLAAYGYLPSRGVAPAWTSRIDKDDRVFHDVGPLFWACARWPGASRCTGTLLMEHADEYYILRSGLDPSRDPAGMLSFSVLDGGAPTDLVLGAAPPGARSVTVTLSGAERLRVVNGRVTAPRAAGGTTLWWASVSDPVADVRFLGDRGREVFAD